MGTKEALFGSGGKMKKFDTMTKQQQKMVDKTLDRVRFSDFDISKNKLYRQGQEFLQGLMRPGALDGLYSQMEAPMMRQFQEEIIPSIAERFSGMGAQSSSAFAQSMGQAGAGLQERLAALKGNLIHQGTQQQLQAAQMGLGYAGLPAQVSQNLLSTGLGAQTFGYQNIAAQPGILQGAAGGISKGIGAGIGAGIGGFFGGPIGAMAGSGIGSMF